MAYNISGFKTSVQIIASVTFPAGIIITEFSDDVDAVDLPVVEIAGGVIGANGDLAHFSKPVILPVNISVIPGGNDDKNLSILLEQNRAARGKISVNDVITLGIVYPDGGLITFKDGYIKSGTLGRAMSNISRFKSKVYGFEFESKSEVMNV